MATMVCHPGLQPCVDSQFIETTWPRIKFSPSLHFVALNSCFHDLDSPKSTDQSDAVDLVLSNHNATDSVLPQSNDAAIAEPKSPMAIKESESESESYDHTLAKRSRSTLDEKSLAICTENLGCETGESDFIDDSVFSDFITVRSPMRKRVRSDHHRCNKKLFPPPLTTITGPDSICVRSYREDGRLMMAAVEAPARFSYVVERSHGRLRLSILKSCAPKIESSKEENEIRIQNDDVEVVGEKGNCEEDVGRKVGGNGNVQGVEIEIEKYKRTCRSDESNNIVENKNNTEMFLFTGSPSSIGSQLFLN